MDVARELRGGAGLLVIAGAQARGRGRAGHSWASPPGGLYMTIVLEASPAAHGSSALALPIVAALAVRAALARAGVAARIKWPNDLYVGRRKIAGAIVESDGAAAALGIGVNVDVPLAALPPELRETATSVREERGGAPADPAAFARDVLEALAPLYRRWLACDPGLVDEARAAAILEYRVRWRAPSGRAVEGIPIGLGARGELLIDAGTEVVAATAGDLEVLWTS